MFLQNKKAPQRMQASLAVPARVSFYKFHNAVLLQFPLAFRSLFCSNARCYLVSCGRFRSQIWTCLTLVKLPFIILTPRKSLSHSVTGVKIMLVPWTQFVRSLVSLLCVNIMSNTTVSPHVLSAEFFSLWFGTPCGVARIGPWDRLFDRSICRVATNSYLHYQLIWSFGLQK